METEELLLTELVTAAKAYLAVTKQFEYADSWRNGPQTQRFKAAFEQLNEAITKAGKRSGPLCQSNAANTEIVSTK